MKRRSPLPIRLTAKITAIAVAAALALTGGLAVRMAQGDDPSLPGRTSSATTHSTTPKATTASQSTSNQPTSSPATVTTRTS
jgi:hypothetical protein